MSRRHLYLLVALLTLVAVTMAGYKAVVLKFPLQPLAEAEAWDVEVRVSFRAINQPVKLSLYVPRIGEAYAAVDEQFISRGFGMHMRKPDGNRQVIWSVRRASGEQFLYYRAVVRPAARRKDTSADKPPKVDAQGFEGAKLIAAGAVLAEVKSHSADSETLVTELLKRLNRPSGDDNVALLIGKKAPVEERLAMAVRLLAEVDIPARVVHGVRLEQFTRDANLVHWLEAHLQGNWQGFDARSGAPGIDPAVLPWWHGAENFFDLSGGSQVNSRVSVSLNREPALLGAIWREQDTLPALFRYSLLGLPIETQAVYRILLTVPIGVFLLVVLRNVVGIKTFGTFMPVLIALAFRETQLMWGLVLFSLVVGLGLAIRFYLENLKLLLVPRLAAVLIVVVTLMSFISIFSHQLGIYRGLSVALFPMVILTMTIERMSIVWEERGPSEALQQGLGSLLVATIAYLVMSLDTLQHLVFLFPELLLLILAVTLLLGRYSGYRLTELFRFKALARSRV